MADSRLAVERALQYKIPHIVTFDWLEDSAQARKAIPAGSYRTVKASRKANQRKEERSKDEARRMKNLVKKHNDGREEARQDLGSSKQISTLTPEDLERPEETVDGGEVDKSQIPAPKPAKTSRVPKAVAPKGKMVAGKKRKSVQQKNDAEEEDDFAADLAWDLGLFNRELPPSKRIQPTPDLLRSAPVPRAISSIFRSKRSSKGKRRSKPGKKNHHPLSLPGTVITLHAPQSLPYSNQKEYLLDLKTRLRAEQDQMVDDITPDRHHVYHDQTINKSLRLTLIHTDSTGRHSRAFLRLFESDAVPHTYAVVARSATNGFLQTKLLGSRLPEWADSRSPEVRAPIGSSWERARKEFELAFKELTGWEWEKEKHLAKKPLMKGDVRLAGEKKLFYWPEARNLKVDE
jgi:hypothetical protein